VIENVFSMILKRIAYHYAIGFDFINFSTNLLFFSSLKPKHLLNNYFKRPLHFRFPANSKKFLGVGHRNFKIQ
jgi:hypothetical protein